MPCAEFEERLAEYAELSVDDRGPVDLHVGQCQACREFLSVLTEMDLALGTAFANRSVSPRLARAVAEKLRTPTMIPEILDGVGWAAILAIVLWLTRCFIPDLEFNMSAAVSAGMIVVLGALWIAHRCYADLRRC